MQEIMSYSRSSQRVQWRQVRLAALTGWLFVVGAAQVGAAAALPQDADPIVRFHDIRALQALKVDELRGVDMRLKLSTSFLDNMEPDRWDLDIEGVSSLSDYGLAEVILDAIAQIEPDAQIYAETRAGMLRVEGDQAGHARVESILADLFRHYLRTVEVELYLLPSGAIPAGMDAVVSPAQAAALIADQDFLEVHQKAIRLGHRALLGTEGTDSFLHDYDVEVAQRARTSDPQVTIMYAGASFGTFVRESSNGGFIVRLWGRNGSLLGEPRTAVLEDFGGVSIELPTMSTSLYTASATLQDGGGMLLVQDRNDAGGWLLRVRSAAADWGSSNSVEEEQSAFIPLDALIAQPMLIRPPHLPYAGPSGGLLKSDTSILEEIDGDPDDTWFSRDEVFEMVLEERDRRGLGGSLIPLGDSIYVRGSSELVQRCQTLIASLVQRLASPTVGVELRYGFLESAETAAFLAARAGDRSELVAAIESLGHRMLGSCRAGDSLLLLGGEESLYLHDTDVEIAEASAIGDPIIRELFEGISFWCRPTTAGPGAYSAWTEISVQMPARAQRDQLTAVWEPHELLSKDSTKEPIGTFYPTRVVELPATARAQVRSMLHTREGVWRVVCCTRIGGSERTLVAAIRMKRIGEN